MAAISGTENAAQIRDKLENRLGPQATLAAQRRSKELLKQIEAGKLKSSESPTVVSTIEGKRMDTP